MRIELREIPDVPGVWQTNGHLIRALAIDGKCPALDALNDWRSREQEDYKKILYVLQRVSGMTRVNNPNWVKADRKKSGVYEIRAHRGSARLFFFYSPEANEVVVLTNAYWKTKPSEAEQERAFERARGLMAVYHQAQPSKQPRSQ